MTHTMPTQHDAEEILRPHLGTVSLAAEAVQDEFWDGRTARYVLSLERALSAALALLEVQL